MRANSFYRLDFYINNKQQKHHVVLQLLLIEEVCIYCALSYFFFPSLNRNQIHENDTVSLIPKISSKNTN